MRVNRNNYPEKRDMNLACREQAKHKPTALAVTVICVAVCLGLFVKFGVMDVLNRVSVAAEEADKAELELAEIQEQTARYDDVLEEYRNYTLASSTMTGDINPMDCFDMIQKQLVEKAQVEAYGVADGFITVQMSGVTLQQVSSIYADLAKSDIVDGVQVYTASTLRDERDTVTATMTVSLRSSSVNEEVARP